MVSRWQAVREEVLEEVLLLTACEIKEEYLEVFAYWRLAQRRRRGTGVIQVEERGAVAEVEVDKKGRISKVRMVKKREEVEFKMTKKEKIRRNLRENIKRSQGSIDVWEDEDDLDLIR